MVTRAGPIDDEIPCSASDSGIGFGPFHLDVQRQILRRDNERVVLGSRAYAILCALLERPGELVSKAELFKRAWPNISVDEANLRVQVGVLRKALGEHGANLVAVAGLGYQINLPVTRAHSRPMPSGSARFQAPVALDEPVGRDEIIASIVQQLDTRRLVTIVGPGGIGKTTLGLAVAKELSSTFRDGVCFVDFGILSDPRLVAAALATALRQPVSTGDPLAAVLTYLMSRELLIILDCCEHVIEEAALIVEQVLSQAPDVRILATSRESLRVTNEVVEKLGGLETPPWNNKLTATEALNFSAIQLFARSARSRSREFEITDENIPLAAEICHRLDGIPLAIELAAALTGLLGLTAMRDSLDRRFAVLTLGRRTSLPRHRTLAATMAWSYDLLSDNERAVLRRLSTFASQFTMEAAIVVSSGDYIDEVEATRCIIDLAGKSLLTVDRRHKSLMYRLLETTRVYARQQIVPSEERDKAALRHARYYLALLEAMDWEIYDPKQSRGSIAEYVEEVRGAIDWAYASGASDLAIDLTLAAERPWLELGLIAAIIQRMRQALEGLEASAPPDRRQRMKVLTALGTANVYAFSLDQSPLLFQNALMLANELNDRTYQMRTLWGLFHYHMMSRMPSKALEFARHFERLAAENPEHPDSLLADHQIGWCLLELGELTTSKEHVERFLTRYTSPHRSHSVLFASDKRMSAQVFLGDLHWLQGSPERGLAVVEAGLAEAEKLQHPQSSFYALAYGTCFVALFSWNLLAARRHLQALESVVLQYKPWVMIALAYRGMLARQEGDLPLARRYLEEAMATGSPVRTAGLYPLLLVELADVRRMTGDLDGAEHVADLAHKCQRGPLDVAIICTALRAKAEIMADRYDESCLKQAEALFEQSINLSRTQGALTLELASAVGLSRYWVSRERAQEAHSLLKGVVDRITEGHDLPPMIEARALMKSLEGSVELS